MNGPITKFQAPRKRGSNIEALVLLVTGVTVGLAIAIAIVVIMAEFCRGLWLRPLSQDLFSARVHIIHYYRYINRKKPRTPSLLHESNTGIQTSTTGECGGS